MRRRQMHEAASSAYEAASGQWRQWRVAVQSRRTPAKIHGKFPRFVPPSTVARQKAWNKSVDFRRISLVYDDSQSRSTPRNSAGKSVDFNPRFGGIHGKAIPRSVDFIRGFRWCSTTLTRRQKRTRTCSCKKVHENEKQC